MTLIERIEVTLWQWRYAFAKRRADVRLAKRDLQRAESNGWYRRGVLAFLCCLALPVHACIPRQVNRAITVEMRRCDAALQAATEVSVEAFNAEVARCHSNLDRIHR